MLTPNKKHCQSFRKSLGHHYYPQIKRQSKQIKNNNQLLVTCDKQNVAKDILIQVAQFEEGTLQTPHTNGNRDRINSWFSPEKSSKRSPHIKERNRINLIYTRNTKSATGTPIAEKHEDSQYMNKEQTREKQNTIQKLKEALKKLESPEKKKQKKSIKRRNEGQNASEIISSIIERRKKNDTKIQDLIRLKECQFFKHGMNTERSKVLTANDSKRNSFRLITNRIIPSFPTQPLQLKKTEQLFNIKEARKNRTLKNILQ